MNRQEIIDALTEVSEAVLKNTALEQQAIENIEYTIDWFQHEAELLDMQINVIEELRKKKDGNRRNP